MRKRRRRALRPLCDYLDDRSLPSGFTPAQITSAYGLNAISLSSSAGTTVTGDGTGQTIALIETYHDPNIQASLNAFDIAYGLPHLTLTVINQAGSQTDSDWSVEESLDVEWAHAIAPGARSSWWRPRPTVPDGAGPVGADGGGADGRRVARRVGRLDELGNGRVQWRDCV